MKKPVLYGLTISPPVRSVLLTARAIGLEIELKEVDTVNKEHLSEEFVKKNPQHTIPVLEDDGRYIWDSHAISTYLIRKYAKDDSLYPKDPYRRAVVDQRLHFDSGVLFIRLRIIAEEIISKDHPLVPYDKIKKLHEGYDFLEKFLEPTKFLAGNEMTVADLCCIATVTSMQAYAPLDQTKYPNVARWMENMKKLPYYDEANGMGAEILVSILKSLLNIAKEKEKRLKTSSL